MESKQTSLINDNLSNKALMLRPLAKQSLAKAASLPLLFGLLLPTALFTTSAHSALSNANDDFTDVRDAARHNFAKTKDGCYLYKPLLSFGHIVEWDGACPNGYADGQGTAKWYNKDGLASTYTGTYTRGKLQGKGRIDWHIEVGCEYDYYEGELKDSQPFGQGTMRFTDGNQYQGGFAPRGETTTGIFTWGPGSDYYSDRYEGEFLNGNFHGHGVYTWGEHSYWAGDRYEGEYRKGRHHGYGTYTSSDGTSYEGNWENHVKSGYGKVSFTDGSVYKGIWNNDFSPNYGIRTWPNGARYEGETMDGTPHGHGKMTYPNGITYEGDFEYSQREGHGTLTYTDGAWLDAEFKDDEPNGQGINVRANGIRYEGQFRGYDAWGFGHLTVPKAAFNDDKRAKNGVWQGDTFIEKGWFYDNKFKFPCDNHEHCLEVAASNPEYQQYMD